MAYAEEVRNLVPARIIGGTSLRGDVLQYLGLHPARTAEVNASTVEATPFATCVLKTYLSLGSYTKCVLLAL